MLITALNFAIIFEEPRWSDTISNDNDYDLAALNDNYHNDYVRDAVTLSIFSPLLLALLLDAAKL